MSTTKTDFDLRTDSELRESAKQGDQKAFRLWRTRNGYPEEKHPTWPPLPKDNRPSWYYQRTDTLPNWNNDTQTMGSLGTPGDLLNQVKVCSRDEQVSRTWEKRSTLETRFSEGLDHTGHPVREHFGDYSPEQVSQARLSQPEPTPEPTPKPERKQPLVKTRDSLRRDVKKQEQHILECIKAGMSRKDLTGQRVHLGRLKTQLRSVGQ